VLVAVLFKDIMSEIDLDEGSAR